MSTMRMPFTIGGQWVTGLTIVALIMATTGCDGVNITIPGGDDPNDLFGVIINTDTSKDLIGGVRLRTGESVYAFGTWRSDGSVGEVTACVYENASGQQASLFFESGRPSRGVGFDGSEVVITYELVTAERLKGSATYTPAGGGPAITADFDIDLLATAAQVSQLVRDLTGLQITSEEPPDEPEALAGTTSKVLGRAADVKSSLVIVLVPIFIAVTGFAITLTVSQIMRGFVQAGNVVVIAFLTPFILMGNLMRAAMGLPLVTIQYNNGHPNINIPRP